MPDPKPIKFYEDENGCWICTSHKSKKFNGKTVNVHTYMYLTRVSSEIPEGKLVTRTCGNNKCINPEHLTLMTRAELNDRTAKNHLAHPIEFEVDPVTGCHNCTSHPADSRGYCRIRVDDVLYLVHRYVYEKEVYEKKYGKKIPKELKVRHKCDNPRCINLDHLELGTQGDNVRDMVERNRQAKGSKKSNSKLTEDAVREIRRRLADGEKVAHLARIYGVCEQLIYDIKNRKRWKHVD